jgi:hypothetical protein
MLEFQNPSNWESSTVVDIEVFQTPCIFSKVPVGRFYFSLVSLGTLAGGGYLSQSVDRCMSSNDFLVSRSSHFCSVLCFSPFLFHPCHVSNIVFFLLLNCISTSCWNILFHLSLIHFFSFYVLGISPASYPMGTRGKAAGMWSWPLASI